MHQCLSEGKFQAISSSTSISIQVKSLFDNKLQEQAYLSNTRVLKFYLVINLKIRFINQISIKSILENLSTSV